MDTVTTDARPDSHGYEVARGVYRFGTRRVNWYVLVADGGLTVVDAGLPGHLSQLEDWLSERGDWLGDVDALVLTHADPDHVGFASDLAEAGVPVYCHPADRGVLRSYPHGAPGWFYRNLWRPGFLAYAVELVRNGVRAIDPDTDVEPFEDDAVLPIPGEPRVLHAPGHTPGSCALFVADRDVLFCGDVLATRNIYADREGDPQLLGPADDDHETARASLDRLAGLGTVTLLPGHGDPWRGDVDEARALAR